MRGECDICNKPVPVTRLGSNTCSKNCYAKKKRLLNPPRLELRNVARQILKNRPQCCTEKQWEEWHSVNTHFKKRGFTDIFCDDCTSEYQEKMIAEEKCLCPFYEMKEIEDDLDGPVWVKV